MIRSAAFQNPMARLALAAMLLLALLPTIGRLAGAASASDTSWAALCTMTGLKVVALDAGDGTPAQPQPGTGIDQHCAYCPLLATIAVLAFCLALLWPQRRDDVRTRGRQAPWHLHFHPCGLGSRGPPLAL